MAQSGYTPILIYASGTSGHTPSDTNLTSSAAGAELALNYYDGKLFYKDNAGVVQLLASKASASGITINSTTISGGTSGRIMYDNAGTVGEIAATSIQFSTGTLSLAGNFTTSGAYNWGFTVPGAYTYTLPSANATLARTDAAQTFTGNQTVNGIIWETINSGTTSQFIKWGDGSTAYTQVGGYYDSANNGHLEFYTLNSGVLTEFFRIASTGAFGLSGANYGTSGQVLTSGGSSAAPTWTTPSSGITTGKSIAMAMIFGF